MKHAITGLGSSGTRITISEKEFNNLKEAKKHLSAGLAIEEEYDVLVANYIDFEKEIADITIEWMLSHPRGYSEFRDYIARCNKRLINLLTASRLYIDHVKHHVENIINVSPKENTRVLVLFAERYDKYIEYRFMEALRNHVQHYGLPVHETSLGSRLIDPKDPAGEIVYTIDFAAQTKKLKENRKFKRAILKEMGDTVDLKHSTRKYIECLSEIHGGVRKIISERLARAHTILKSYIDRFEKESGGKSIGLSAFTLSYADEVIEEFPLLLDWDDIRIKLSQQNQVLTRLSERYISGGKNRS